MARGSTPSPPTPLTPSRGFASVLPPISRPRFTEPLDVLERLVVVDESADRFVEAFCLRVHPRLVRSLGLYCGDLSVAEEIAQEALVRAWTRWPTVSGLERPDAWLFRVAFNLATSRGRRRTVERRALAASAGVAPTAPADLDDALAVRAAVASLPPRERAAIVLRYFVDLSIVDTAHVMGCKPGTVKSLTSHAIGRLADRLGDDRLQRVGTDG